MVLPCMESGWDVYLHSLRRTHAALLTVHEKVAYLVPITSHVMHPSPDPSTALSFPHTNAEYSLELGLLHSSSRTRGPAPRPYSPKSALNVRQVEMLIVDDDCALPPQRITGRRGLAGTVFVHKVRSWTL